MRTTLQIDEDVIKDAKLIAAAEKRSLGAVISDLARRSLLPIGVTTSRGFPVFDVPPDAPPLTPDDVARAMDDAE